MKRSVPHRVVIFSQTAAALVFICLTPLYATTTLAGILYGLIHGFGLAKSLTWVEWVIVSPIVYVTWLNSFLIACAIDIQAWRLLFGFRKHRRITTANGIRDWFQFHLMLVSYMRERIVWHLPLTQSYLGVEGLRLLVLWAGAPKASLGRGSFLFGLLYDPDLTEIGEDAILGADSTVTAHAMTVNRDGSRVFVTADVTIGARALIGGGARIDLGVRIGSDAIVEPMSYVSPYTNICDGEVWGGNPAQFIRRRFEQPEHISAGVSLSRREDSPAETISPSSDSTDEAELRQLVATALDLSLDEIHADLSANQCAAWDSLGQMAIAAGLHDRYGIMLGANEIFHLKSMADLRRAIMADAARVGHQTSRAADSSARCVDHGLEALKLVSEAVLPRDPELLPLLDHQQATRYLAAHDAGGVATSVIRCESVSVVIASTFVAEPVANSLKLWARAFGIPVHVRFAGFNQVQQCLMAPDSALHQNITGINVVLARPEDFVSETAGSTEAAESLLAAIAIFSKNLPGTLVVGTLPPVVSTFCAADRLDVESLRATWRNRLSQIAGVRMLDFSEVIEQIGIGLAGRSDLEVVARTPYTPRVYQELGIAIARMVRQERIAPAKVIALDADGVLWGGVLGEDGMMGIHLSGDHPGRSFQLFQRQLRSLKDRGCLLVLVSRNEAQDVWRVFDEHPEMVLRRTDIAAARINWQPKSHNLRELAAELNVGLDSFVFIDDDPANHAEVAMNAPGVTVVPMPTDPVLYCQTLSRLWRFDSPHLTAEDQNRAQMVQAEQERKQLHDATADLGSYLKSLRLRVEMRAAKEAELPRVSQLTQKTNQFNTSLKRRSLPEIQSLAKTHAIYVVEASDRFGDYGLIGVAMLVRSSECPKYFVLDTLLISCRALGRGIEDAVLHGLGSVIANDGGQRLVIPCVDGPRNQPCRDFLKRAAMSTRTTGEFEWQTDAELALPTHIEWLGPTLLAERRVA